MSWSKLTFSKPIVATYYSTSSEWAPPDESRTSQVTREEIFPTQATFCPNPPLPQPELQKVQRANAQQLSLGDHLKVLHAAGPISSATFSP